MRLIAQRFTPKWFSLFVLSCFLLPPQDALAKIVHYEKGVGKAQRPDLSRVVVCADVPGSNVLRTISRLRSLKNGPQDFSEPDQPCDTSGPYVWIHPQTHNLGTASSSGWSGSGGWGGGYSSYGSFSGNVYFVRLDMDLVRPGYPTIILGEAAVTAQVGYSSGSGWSYGRQGGSSYSSQGVTPRDVAFNAAINECSLRMLNHGNWLAKFMRQFWHADVTVTWIPGANETVQAAIQEK